MQHLSIRVQPPPEVVGIITIEDVLEVRRGSGLLQGDAINQAGAGRASITNSARGRHAALAHCLCMHTPMRECFAAPCCPCNRSSCKPRSSMRQTSEFVAVPHALASMGCMLC